MITKETTAHFEWHAGLVDADLFRGPSISSCTGREIATPDLIDQACHGFLQVLSDLNNELNGESPDEVASQHLDELPRVLVYSISESMRMLRDAATRCQHEGQYGAIAEALWRIEVGWSAVLAGDVDDILSCIELEERMRD